MVPIPTLYKKHHLDKDYTSIGLFRALKEQYEIRKVFYPGSHVHITPTLIFPEVVYADSFRNTYKFFEDPQTIEFIRKHKEYATEPFIRYYQQDYNKPFTDLGNEFDLLISQYAGFVGQAAKPYLITGGLLVCNNSHGDASMAAIDPDYELFGVYRRINDQKFNISTKGLEEYLIPKYGIQPTKEQLLKSQRGIAYIKSPSGYIFRKLKS